MRHILDFLAILAKIETNSYIVGQEQGCFRLI